MRWRHALVTAVTALAVFGAGVLLWPDERRDPAGSRHPGPASAGPGQAGSPGTSGTPEATAGAGAAPAQSPADRGAPPGVRTLHFIASVSFDNDADRAGTAALGYNLFDMNPYKDIIDRLPAGQRALVWLGDSDWRTCAMRVSWADFIAAVDRLAGNPRVYGYFLDDAPEPKVCPGLVGEIRRRADYIRSRTPSHRSFITADAATGLAPSATHVDFVGVIAYPCRIVGRCRFDTIDTAVRDAAARGVPRSAIVPVFQAFGQSCASDERQYRLPTAGELRTILARWAALLPRPAFDFTFSWHRQGHTCPTLKDAGDLQGVMAEHNS